MEEFYWGGATSASQYEGGYLANKGIDTQDCRPYLPRQSNTTIQTRLLTKNIIEQAKKKDNQIFYPFRKGTMGYEYWKEDIELLDELGINLYRFSISWSRLFPKGIETTPNKAGVDYYDKIFDLLNEKGMTIFLTLNHYAVPLYLVEEYGGWQNKVMIDYYMNFIDYVFKRWGKFVKFWLPFNEINAGYFSPYNGVGLIKPEKKTMIIN